MEPSASPSRITIEARLVHADAGQRVVEVSAWRLGHCLGRCLGEAGSAETAEDRGLTRLRQRLAIEGTARIHDTQPSADIQAAVPSPATPAPAAASEAEPAAAPRARPAPPQRRPAPSTEPTSSDSADAASATAPQLPLLDLTAATPEPTAEEPAPDPEDWSEELAELDVQLQRLSWDRSQEGIYLQRAFGHPSRNRLTAFADLVAYLRALRGLVNGSNPETAPVPLRRRDLLSQCDQLLTSLGWDPQRGRQLLERSFQLSSRQQLSDEQLLQFNMLLESELITEGKAS